MGKIKLWQGPPNIHMVYEGASQSFYEGDLLKMSGGYAVLATDGNDAWGVAARAGHNTTAAGAYQIPVYVITPEQVWSVFTTGTPARATHVGNARDFTGFTAGNVITLSLGTSTNSDAIIQELDPRDTPASGSRVLVRFNYASGDAIGG